MGAVAFAVLMAVELALSSLGFSRTFTDILAGYRSLAGVIGLSAQVIFALLPAAQIIR